MEIRSTTLAIPSTNQELKLKKRFDIQGLRALAVVLVIIEHARWGLSGGFIGVDVFFVISGFVITLSLLRGIQKTGKVKLWEFYKKRFFRLMPVATFVILLSAVFAMFLSSPLGIQQQSAAVGGASLIWLSNIALYLISSDYFSPHVQANPFLHTWSLGVEEQFYLVFPILIVVGWKTGQKARRTEWKVVFFLISVLSLVSFGFSLATSMGHTLGIISNPVQFAFYMMPTRAWEFAVGVLLAFLLMYTQITTILPRYFATALSGIGLTMIVVGAIYISEEMYFPGYIALLPVLGAGLLILGGAIDNRFSEVLTYSPITWIGDRTYSIYLWHWPLMVFARRIWPESELAIFGAVALAVVFADLSFRFVEEPFKKLGHQPLKIRAAWPPLASYVLAGVSCIVLLIGSLNSWGNPQLGAITTQLNERPVGYKECLSKTLVSQRNLESCTWGTERDGAPIYLMGDSNAQQYTEALIEASERLGRPLIIATWGGCSFFDIQMSELGNLTKQRECQAYVEDGNGWLLNQPDGTVLMANAGDKITSENIALAGKVDAEAKADVWEESLRGQLEDLQNMGHSPTLIATAPHFLDSIRDWWHPADCSISELLDEQASCAASISREEFEDQRKLTLIAEKAAAEAGGVKMIDPSDQLCGNVCSTYKDGIWVYRDGLHISPTQSRQMASFFVMELSS